MKKFALALLLFSLGVSLAHAEPGYIVLNVNGVTCTTSTVAGAKGILLSAWSWGSVTQMGGLNGAKVTPGKPSLTQLLVSKSTDTCTTAMLQLNFDEKLSSTVTVTEYSQNGATGKVTQTMMVTLYNALVATYSVNGSTTADNPSETWGFAFQKICLENSNTQTVCYSNLTNQTS